MPNQPQTISVTRRRSRLARLRLVRPDKAGNAGYDAARARELLARTAEIPFGKRALLAILTEYRHALHDLAYGPGLSPLGKPRAHREITGNAGRVRPQ